MKLHIILLVALLTAQMVSGQNATQTNIAGNSVPTDTSNMTRIDVPTSNVTVGNATITTTTIPKNSTSSPPPSNKTKCLKPLFLLDVQNLCCFNGPGKADEHLIENCSIKSYYNRTNYICCFNDTEVPFAVSTKTEKIGNGTKITRYVEWTSEVIKEDTILQTKTINTNPQEPITSTTIKRPVTTTTIAKPTLPATSLIIPALFALIVIVFLVVIWRLGRDNEPKQDDEEGEE